MAINVFYSFLSFLTSALLFIFDDLKMEVGVTKFPRALIHPRCSLHPNAMVGMSLEPSVQSSSLSLFSCS